MLGIPVDELFDRMSADTFGWYLAFSAIEPFGAIHDERRAAMTASATLAPYTKKGLSLSEMSPYLDDCADFGTDTKTKEQSKAAKNEAMLRTFTALPGWRKVSSGEEAGDGSDSES